MPILLYIFKKLSEIDLNSPIKYWYFLLIEIKLSKERKMNLGKTIFSQIMDFLPQKQFRKCVDKYDGNYRVHSFSCSDQFLCKVYVVAESKRICSFFFMFRSIFMYGLCPADLSRKSA